tara:strand:+ start:405 stop:560 length:156 start_codon:yes stop_codon:yes gene_type:complete
MNANSGSEKQMKRLLPLIAAISFPLSLPIEANSESVKGTVRGTEYTIYFGA